MILSNEMKKNVNVYQFLKILKLNKWNEIKFVTHILKRE